LVFAGSFFSLVGTGARSYAMWSVVDNATERELKHSYNIAALHKTCILVWFI